MRDQLFADGRAYPAYCAEHQAAKRSQLRAANLADLKARAELSWQLVAPAVEKLRANGISDVQRYWIVNGFACHADGAAIAALTRLPGVAYVHRQVPAGALGKTRPRPQRWLAQREADEQRALQLLQKRGAEAAFATDGLQVPWNLKAVRAEQAWQLGATGAGVKIAIIDSGLLCFPPLVNALWQNPGEQLDGKDNDGNGYVDDLFGWDFGGATRFAVGDGKKSHGTMCAGILAGRPWGKSNVVTGVAPRAQLMVLRGSGRLSAYEYAAQMGADVLSMSYMMMNPDLGSFRGVFRTAHEHLAACGVVAVGGAGNFAKTAEPGHQIALPKDIPCVIAASGVGRNMAVPSFSSRGPCMWDDVPFFADYPESAPLQKPDVCACAAGFPVWHWVQAPGRRFDVQWQNDDGFGLVVGPRGNSFSGPHAGGVAALMLSAQPELPAWRVQELMIESCRDLGKQGWDATHGAGMLRADEAVRLARAAKIN